MSKGPAQPDVLVLGQHPCAYLAAALLLAKPGLIVAHAPIPGEHPPDRLVIINPELFALHKPLEKLRKKLELTPVWGLRFIADSDGVSGESRSKLLAGLIGCYEQVRKAIAAVAKAAGTRMLAGKALTIERVYENGLDVVIDGHRLRPRALLLAGTLPKHESRMLALPEPWNGEVMRRYSFLRVKGDWTDLGDQPIIPMSLDLKGNLTWAWLLPGKGEVQLAVEQPIGSVSRISPAELVAHWARVLRNHQLLKPGGDLRLDAIEHIDIPSAGALARESVADRTLLIGPAGGFYTACLEDIYPNCWSALFAADTMRKALTEPHLQDALQPYRQQWSTTLGDYLRGPQQNLRFLLPLVYRNPVMTSRLAESILSGKSVVR